MTTDAEADQVAAALATWQARRDRLEQPDGHHQSNGVGAWYPSASERQPCCARITPTIRSEQVLLLHARSPEHIARLYGIPPHVLAAAIRRDRRTSASRGSARI